MRLSTAASIGLFVISAAACAYSVTVVNNNLDTGVPQITQDSDKIKISIKDGDEAILQGITAVDSKDGDVTSSLVVESLSNFIETGVRKATIVAFDSDNHIARITREVEYTDYTHPRFALDGPLQFSENVYTFFDGIQVEDCLDGDISNKLHLNYKEEYDYQISDLKAMYSVSNSVGDTVTLPVTITRYDPAQEGQKPTINLKEYLIYVDKDEKVDPLSYVYSIYMSGKTYKLKNGKMTQTGTAPTVEPDVLGSDRLQIDVGEAEDGVYEIAYTVTDFKDEEDSMDDVSKTVRLIVVTEE